MKIKMHMNFCRMPAGRCGRVVEIDRKGKRVKLRDVHQRAPFWISVRSLGKWRLPGQDSPVGKLSLR